MKDLIITAVAMGILAAAPAFAEPDYDNILVEEATFGEPTFVNKPADAPVAAHGCATFKHLPLRQSVADQLKAANKCLVGLGNSVHFVGTK